MTLERDNTTQTETLSIHGAFNIIYFLALADLLKLSFLRLLQGWWATVSTMQNYPFILSLPDGTDVVIEPTNQPLTITISTQGDLPEEKRGTLKPDKPDVVSQVDGSLAH